MRTEHGEFELSTPRDRNGSFEPQIIKKNQTYMSDEIEKKILSLFSLGSSYSQIADHIQEIYGVHFSKPAIPGGESETTSLTISYIDTLLMNINDFKL